ncbi:D-alanyl-D-alanine carboxypeptidase/D-alanyl-D-alanine-endopeptidase [Sagittula sp. NFXS13]|uniref:D-alanyl-D-alanine carboxypeptidase/D-alanyl-D-alanine endopeptidase n=1 Tax=Sagittula sp. NFXS13 TaxID=2819095 RepID=UPI0032E0329A
MTKLYSRRLFLSAASAAAMTLPISARANAPARSLRPVSRDDDLLLELQASAEELIADARLDGDVSFVVARADTGEVLEAHDADLGLPPASVAKALTAGYALAHLGAEYRFTTRVLATGELIDGVVQGDLILAGSGDPTLDTDGLATLAQGLAAAGVTGVTGALKIWGGALPYVRGIDPLQPDHVGYNPSVSGLNLNYNRVHFEWHRAGSNYSVSMDARSAKHRPSVRMASMVVEPRSTPIYTYSDVSGQDSWTVARNALGDSGARWLPVRKPELYAGEVFQSLVRAQGIAVGEPQVIQALPEVVNQLASLDSAPLRDILYDMLKWSTNLTAEVVGMTATAQRTGRVPKNLEESAQVLNTWAADSLGVTTLALTDHSGLGERSRVKSKDMMSALIALNKQDALKPLLKSFGMRDARGRPMDNHPIKVHAKTGTLNFVSGLAGFADLPDGTELVFAIFVANLDRRATLSVAQRERPEGGASWNRRAKILQQKLIERWGVVYAA